MSLIMFLYRASKPYIGNLARISGSIIYTEIDNNDDKEIDDNKQSFTKTVPGIAILSFHGSLFLLIHQL